MKIGVIPATGLGDGLLYMVLSHHLSLAGHEVTTFSPPLLALQAWFPGQKIAPLQDDFADFDLVVASDHALRHSPDFLIPERSFNKKQTIVENLITLLKTRFAIDATKENGITLPQGVIRGRHPHVVALHPMSLEAKRCWPASKFIALAKLLLKEGFEPALCLAAHERPHFEPYLKNGPEILFPHFQNLSECAAFIASSGYLIGNNSGLGHLASALGVPTLSLFARKSYSHLWRPAFGPGIVVTPPPLLLGSRLKEKYWKQLLTPQRVFKHFKKESLR